MNNILQLKGQFDHQRGNAGFGPRTLPVNSSVKCTHIIELQKDLERLLTYWNSHTLIRGALISVYYHSVVAKSNRIRGLLCKGMV